MSKLLSKIKADEFLQSFESKAEIVILESATESKKLASIAKARGINLRKNRDLSGFKAIYAFADKANKNGAILPEKALLKGLPSIIGKPVNLRHERAYVVGHILDYAYQQKEKRVIVYGVFYKSAFEDEWKNLKKDFKAKKLTVSFEIWNPANKRKVLANGDYLMLEQEMAGMAILPRDTEPAFDGANMLEFAQKKIRTDQDLVKGAEDKYDDVDVHYYKKSVEENYKKMQEEENKLPIVQCLNCKTDIETSEEENINCPTCYSILNKSGEIIHPSQKKDFNIFCPSCNSDDFLIKSNKEDIAEVACKSCKKEYQLTFKKVENEELRDKMRFLFIGQTPCPQCNSRVHVECISNVDSLPVTCKECNLDFTFFKSKSEKIKKISTICEIFEEAKKPVEEKEGREEEVDIPEEIVKIVKEEDKKKVVEKKEAPSEIKEEPKVEKVAPKVEKTEPVAEKVELKTEPVVETVPKKSAKAETPLEATIKESEVVTATEEEPVLGLPDAEKAIVKENLAKIDEKVMEDIEEASSETPVEEVPEAPVEETKEEPITSSEKVDVESEANTGDIANIEGIVVETVPSEDATVIEEIPEVEEKTFDYVGESVKTDLVVPVIAKSTKSLRRAVKKNRKLKDVVEFNLTISKAKKETLVTAIKKTVSQVISLKEEVAKIKRESEEKITFYKANALEIISRKSELGEEYSSELSDSDLLNDDKFELAKLQKESDLLQASKDTKEDDMTLSSKPSDSEDETSRQAKEITAKSFGAKKRNA